MCRSFERTRVIQFLLDKHFNIRGPDRRSFTLPLKGILRRSFASPSEKVITPSIIRRSSSRSKKLQKFDLCSDTEALVSEYYDVILHSHVMEHIPCNYTAVLYHLHRALKKDGIHLFCIPVIPNTRYACDFGPLTPGYAVKQYGQADHVRRFGALDIQEEHEQSYRISHRIRSPKCSAGRLLDRHNIPDYARHGWTPNSVLSPTQG